MPPLISTLANNLLPPGWRMTHTIFLDPEWQVNASDEEHVVVATGLTIELALTAAHAKVLSESFSGRIFSLEHMAQDIRLAGRNLAEVLGLVAKPGKIRRR